MRNDAIQFGHSRLIFVEITVPPRVPCPEKHQLRLVQLPVFSFSSPVCIRLFGVSRERHDYISFIKSVKREGVRLACAGTSACQMVGIGNPAPAVVNLSRPGIPNPGAFCLAPTFFIGFSQALFLQLPPPLDDRQHSRVSFKRYQR
jgi:hypothetical protein